MWFPSVGSGRGGKTIWLEKGLLFVAFSSHADSCITHCVVLERLEALGGREAAACVFHVTSALDVCLDLQLHSARCSEDRLFKISRNVVILLTWGGCGRGAFLRLPQEMLSVTDPGLPGTTKQPPSGFIHTRVGT